jgi:hypothetical protein
MSITTNNGDVTQSAGTLSASILNLTTGSGNANAIPVGPIQTSAGTVNITSSGSINLNDAMSATVSGTTGSLTITDAASLTFGAMTVGNALSATAGNSISSTAAVQANTVQFVTGTNGNISLGANVIGTTSVTYTAGSGGIISQSAGTTSGATLTINSTTNTTLPTAVTNVNINTAGAQTTLNNNGTLNINSLAASDLTVNNTGSLNLNTAANVGVLMLDASGAGSSINLNAGVNATSATLTASNSITQSAGTLSATNATLTATGGNIGAPATPINIAISNLTSNAPAGSMYLSQTGALSFSGDSGSGGTTILTVNGAVTNDKIVSGTSLLQITSSGALSVGGTGQLSATNIQLSSSSSSVNVTQSQINGLLSGSSAAGGDFTVTSTGSDITIGGGNVSSGRNVSLTTSGAANQITLVAGSQVNAANNVVFNTASSTIDGSVSAAAGGVTIQNNGNLAISGTGSLSSTTGTSLLVAAGGSLSISGSLLSNGTTTFTTLAAGDLNVANAGSFTVSGGNLSITTTGGTISVANDGTLNAGANSIVINSDGDVSVTTGNTTSLLSATGGISVSSTNGSVSIDQGMLGGKLSGSAQVDYSAITEGTGAFTTLITGNISTQAGSILLDARQQSVDITGALTAAANVTVRALVDVGLSAGGSVSAGTLTVPAGKSIFSTKLTDYDYSAVTRAGGVNISTTNGDISLASGTSIFSGGDDTVIQAGNNFTENGASLFAQAGNVCVNAVGTVPGTGTMSFTGGSITAVARYTNSGFFIIDGQKVPSFTGGGVVILSGSVANIGSSWSTDTFGRTYGDPAHVGTGVTVGGASTLEPSAGGYITLQLQGGGTMTVTGGSKIAATGFVDIDPPTDITLSGISINAVQPGLAAPPLPPTPFVPLPPPPPPVSTTVSLPFPETAGLPAATGNSSSTIAPTDSTKQTYTMLNTVIVNNICASVPLAPSAEVGLDESWSLASGACQSFGINSDDGTTLTGVGGTAVAQTAEHEVNLKQGKLIAVAGKNGLAVRTASGVINLPADSSAIIDEQRPGIIRVEHLDGAAATVNVMKNGQSKTFTAEAGQEVVVADDGTSDEELIPTDGVERITVYAHIRVASVVIQKNKFDRHVLAERDPLINCTSSCVPVHVRNRLHKLKASIETPRNTASVPVQTNTAECDESNSHNPLRPVAQVVSPAELPSNLNVVGTGSAVMRYVANSKFSFVSDNTIKLEQGEVVIVADKDTFINTGATTVEMRAGSVVIVKRNATATSVATVWEPRNGAVHARVEQREFAVPVGNEYIWCKSDAELQKVVRGDSSGRRRIHTTELTSGSSIMTSEVSFISLLGGSPVLQRMYKSQEDSDKDLTRKLSKMAVVLSVVTSGHGAFSPVTLNK